jgi:magnesium transporter
MDINHVAVENILSKRTPGRCDIYDECLHVSAAAPDFDLGYLSFTHVDMILGEKFIITLHAGSVEFIDYVAENYRYFFLKFAQTIGFLLFDMWNKLIETYRRALLKLADEVERLQSNILGNVDEEIFSRVSNATHDLLQLRKHVLALIEILEQLSQRKSGFVSESTKPFLANMVVSLERLSKDLMTEREILAETLNLYMGIVSHKTNKIVNRLTIISFIFLPLTFICGVYGMNFQKNFPEINWDFGYQYFWILVVTIIIIMLFLMKRLKWW